MSQNSASIEDLLSGGGKAKLKGSPAPASNDDTGAKTPKRTAAEISPEEKLSGKLRDVEIKDLEAKVAAAAAAAGFPYIDLTAFPVSGDALQTVAENICLEQKVVCFVNTGEQIRLASTVPTNPEIEKIKHNLEEAFHAKVAVYMCSERSLQKGLDMYARLPKYKKSERGVRVSEEELEKFAAIANDFRSLNEEIQKVNMTDLMTLIVAAALQADSSDIHIEAEESGVKVRFRVDGYLHDVAEIKKDLWPKVIARLKLLSGLKMNIMDKPQDGRFEIKTKKEDLDVRVSCLPTTWGESVVMRLLKSSSIKLEFEKLGLTGKSYQDLKAQVERPNGMIVTTGPTGSGKTTTLYAILNKLNKEDTKIITLEDPVEYKLEGVNQSQIDHSKGYSFADGLRSILRQDPDVVMVGELRDLETADVSINAALTGHIVISTIHTNSAAGAIPRFLAMGVKPFLLAPALNAIMGQRLCRRLCEKCKREAELAPEVKERVVKLLNEIPDTHPDKPKNIEDLKFYSAPGCDACHGLGYKGRVGIYEIMPMTPEIEKVILSGAVSEYDMQAIAVKNNMLTMAQDGLIKASQGITSVEEVFGVAE